MFNHQEYQAVPDVVLESFDLWAKKGISPGSFGKAVLANDLKEAVIRADLINRKILPEIVRYCYNELPSACWGSKEEVENWEGLEGS